MTSIRRGLLLWLLAPLAILALVADGVTYFKAREQLLAFLDFELQAAAAAAAEGGQIAGNRRLRSDSAVPQAAASGPPLAAEAGAATVRWEGRDWRVVTVERDGRRFQVAEPLDPWRARIRGGAVEIITPFTVAVVPLMGLLVWFGVGRGLQPLNRLAESVRRRSPGSLEPLSESALPTEAQPLVRSLNSLLAQLSQVLANERRFIADAAHGLRTPLTALHLQVENLAHAQSEQERVAAIEQLQGSAVRLAHLAEQLLTMARLAPREAAAHARVAVDLEQLVKGVLVEQQPLAQRRRIDLGITRIEPLVLQADRDGLRAALANLVDNAVRYTPEGGVVDVAVRRDGDDAVIEVADTGPGIAAAERPRVLQRFYRGESACVPGTGLGLSIVAEVMKQHDGRVELGAGGDGRGLIATLRLPLPAGSGDARA